LITPPHDPSPELVPAPDVVVPAEAVANVAPVEFSGSTMFSSDCVLRNGDVMKARVENLEDMVQLLRTDYADGLTAADVKKFADVLSEMILPFRSQGKLSRIVAKETLLRAGLQPPARPQGSSFGGDVFDFLLPYFESDNVCGLIYTTVLFVSIVLCVYAVCFLRRGVAEYSYISGLRAGTNYLSHFFYNLINQLTMFIFENKLLIKKANSFFNSLTALIRSS